MGLISDFTNNLLIKKVQDMNMEQKIQLLTEKPLDAPVLDYLIDSIGIEKYGFPSGCKIEQLNFCPIDGNTMRMKLYGPIEGDRLIYNNKDVIDIPLKEPLEFHPEATKGYNHKQDLARLMVGLAKTGDMVTDKENCMNYIYGKHTCVGEGWRGRVNEAIMWNEREQPFEVKKYILGKPLTSLNGAFQNTKILITLPIIPNGNIDMKDLFTESSIIKIPDLTKLHLTQEMTKMNGMYDDFETWNEIDNMDSQQIFHMIKTSPHISLDSKIQTILCGTEPNATIEQKDLSKLLADSIGLPIKSAYTQEDIDFAYKMNNLKKPEYSKDEKCHFVLECMSGKYGHWQSRAHASVVNTIKEQFGVEYGEDLIPVFMDGKLNENIKIEKAEIARVDMQTHPTYRLKIDDIDIYYDSYHKIFDITHYHGKDAVFTEITGKEKEDAIKTINDKAKEEMGKSGIATISMDKNEPNFDDGEER